MPITAVALVPTDPRLLATPAAGHDPSLLWADGAIRDAVDEVVARLPTTSAVLLLLADDESLVIDAHRAAVEVAGTPPIAADIVLDAALIAAVSARGQAPRVRSDRLSGGAATLALLLHQAWPGLPVAPVTVPRRASATGLARVATGLVSAISAIGRDVVVLAAGDLAGSSVDARPHSPGSAKRPVAGAGDLDRDGGWNAAADLAIQAGDPGAFGALGPQAAQRVGAAGWAPITVALDLAGQAGWRFRDTRLMTADGIGWIVAG